MFGLWRKTTGPQESLYEDSRWSRQYRSADGRHVRFESRFQDGTATVTLSELETEWPRWNQHCAADVPDRAEILRLLIKNGDHSVWSLIASNVAMFLPATETVPFLKQRCLTAKVGEGANYFQALALTKGSDGLDFLRDCFTRVWNTDGLLDDADFCNWVAHDAIWCINYMIELGEDAASLRSAYETLKSHTCASTREQAQKWLSKHFEVGRNRSRS